MTSLWVGHEILEPDSSRDGLKVVFKVWYLKLSIRHKVLHFVQGFLLYKVWCRIIWLRWLLCVWWWTELGTRSLNFSEVMTRRAGFNLMTTIISVNNPKLVAFENSGRKGDNDGVYLHFFISSCFHCPPKRWYLSCFVICNFEALKTRQV